MNFLELCREVVSECGLSGARGGKPSTVVSQSGMMERVVKWVQRSNRSIQVKYSDWTFMAREYDTVVAPEMSSVRLTDTHADVAQVNETGVYVRDVDSRRELEYVPWEMFRDMRARQVIQYTSELPYQFSASPSGDIHFNPICERQFVLRTTVVVKPQQLAEDDDVSFIPEEFHDVIMWKAVMEFHKYDENPNAYQMAEIDYREWMQMLEDASLPGRSHYRASRAEIPLTIITE